MKADLEELGKGFHEMRRDTAKEREETWEWEKEWKAEIQAIKRAAVAEREGEREASKRGEKSEEATRSAILGLAKSVTPMMMEFNVAKEERRVTLREITTLETTMESIVPSGVHKAVGGIEKKFSQIINYFLTPTPRVPPSDIDSDDSDDSSTPLPSLPFNPTKGWTGRIGGGASQRREKPRSWPHRR